MKKSTAVAILSVALLVAALAISVNAVMASRSYLDCALRLTSEAPSGDRLPPESFRRLSRVFWGKRDVYLARVLARECANEPGKAPGGLRRQAIVLGTLSVRLPSDQRENLAATFMPAYSGRGLTHSARTEWGRPPEALNDSEMTWLFVVAQDPNCTRARAVPEQDQQHCADVYERMLSELRSLDSAAPVT